MNFLKKTNKKFEYQPRYYKGKGNPYEFKHIFDQYRTTIGKNKGLKRKFLDAVDELKNSKGLNYTFLIIVIVLTLIFLYIIDFDLSIFLSKN